MPKATRNTNTNRGSDASAPAKPSTCRNTIALMPSAAPKESTTVAIRISGDRIARSSTISTIITTISTSGMISRLSRAEACSMSALIADAPPTSASAPSTWCTAARTSPTVAKAALDVGSDSRGAETRATSPFTIGGDGSPSPSTPCMAERTASPWSALATTITGLAVSASPWSVSTC